VRRLGALALAGIAACHRTLANWLPLARRCFAGFRGSYTLGIDGKERRFVLESGYRDYGDEQLQPDDVW
jgi:hypothetical protein